MPEVKLTAKIDMAEVDESIQKLQRLNELLKEANSLIHELASTELNLNVEL